MTSASTPSQPLEPRYIEANGLRFAYLEARPTGSAAKKAPFVLCLHGFPDTAWSFSKLLPRLADAGYHAVALFMRGYAPTALASDGNYSITELGRDVIALFEHFGIDKGHVVGHDWGAGAAYAAAGMRPDRIASIVTAGLPHVRRFLLRPSRAQLNASGYIFSFQVPWTPERRMARDDFAWLRQLVQNWSPNWNIADDYWTHLTQAFAEPGRRHAAMAYYRDLRRAMFRRDTWRYLMHPLQVPARVIRGTDDHCILPASFEGQAHLFGAGYELVTLQGAGHFMHLEQPDVFAAEVLKGLAGADASSAVSQRA